MVASDTCWRREGEASCLVTWQLLCPWGVKWRELADVNANCSSHVLAFLFPQLLVTDPAAESQPREILCIWSPLEQNPLSSFLKWTLHSTLCGWRAFAALASCWQQRRVERLGKAQLSFQSPSWRRKAFWWSLKPLFEIYNMDSGSLMGEPSCAVTSQSGWYLCDLVRIVPFCASSPRRCGTPVCVGSSL